MVAQQRSQRQQQHNNANPNGYQPQYQSNYDYCATPQPTFNTWQTSYVREQQYE